MILYPGEDGYWVADCSSLPGCITQGRTKLEALTSIRRAIEIYIEVLEERNQPVPEDRLEAVLVAV